MKRVLQAIQNTGIIFLLAVVILLVVHKAEARSTVETSSLLNLLVICAATQVISVIMDHITIRPLWLHMLTELLAMECMVLALGFVFGLLSFEHLSDVLVDILLIAAVYGSVVLVHFIFARYSAEEINQYLRNKAKSESNR